MSNIVKAYDNQLITQLPINLQKYIIAKNGIIISSLKTSKAITSIYDIITQSMINSGNKKDSDDVDLITMFSESVYQLIQTRYKSLTIEEFKIICFNGVSLEYGEFYGINLTTISNWIKSFVNDINRINSMKQYDNLIDLTTVKEKTLEQKEKIIVDGLLALFEEQRPVYELHKDKFKFEMPQISHIFYLLLKEKGLINFTTKRKTEIYDRSVSIYEQKQRLKKIKPSEKLSSAKYDSIMANLSKDGIFSNLCKLEALREFLFDLYEVDEDLNNLINVK